MTAAGAFGTISAAIVAFAAAAGCGGPLDTPDPRPRRDAGVDTGSGGHRVVDAAPDLVRDARPIPDLALRDAGADTRDSGVDAQWPIVPGCVTGSPPTPVLTPQIMSPITVSCARSAISLADLSDMAGHGLVFDVALDPPLPGFNVFSPGSLCSYSMNAEIDLTVDESAALPGDILGTNLNVTLRGPVPSPTVVLPLQFNTVAIDFTVDPAVIDFGFVYPGLAVNMPVTVTNGTDSAPLSNVFPTQFSQGPFQLFEYNVMGQPLQPGETQQFLEAVLQAQTPGTYDATFLVSAFAPGTTVNISCGVVRTISMHAQVVQTLPP